MPSETSPHDRIWMAFPPFTTALGTSAQDIADARRAWVDVAHVILDFEAVSMVVDPGDVTVARELLSSEIDLVEIPLNDAWMRDIGPTFVLDGGGRLAGVDWVFNGWGQATWASWERDATVAKAVLDSLGCPTIGSTLVNEGGGIHVDGQGTVLVTETVQRGAGRNPHLTRAEVEAEFARTIGATHAVWLSRGLTRDYETFGTRGHVDIVATITSPGVLLLHDQRSPEHPDYAVTALLREQLSETTDTAGRSWDLQSIPAPTTLNDDQGFVDYSYVNHLVVNGGVIACAFDDPVDAEAAEILASVYPGREVIGVEAREIFARGGGIHCITQQQPSAPA